MQLIKFTFPHCLHPETLKVEPIMAALGKQSNYNFDVFLSRNKFTWAFTFLGLQKIHENQSKLLKQALQMLWKAALWIVHVYPQTPKPTTLSSTPRRLFLSFTARHSPTCLGVQESTTTPWHQSIWVNWQWKYLEGKQPFTKSRCKPGHIGLLKKSHERTAKKIPWPPYE